MRLGSRGASGELRSDEVRPQPQRRARGVGGTDDYIGMLAFVLSNLFSCVCVVALLQHRHSMYTLFCVVLPYLPPSDRGHPRSGASSGMGGDRAVHATRRAR